MNSYVYEVVSTNNKNGNKEREFFDSERAANRWKESKDYRGTYTSEVCKHRLWSNKDI